MNSHLHISQNVGELSHRCPESGSGTALLSRTILFAIRLYQKTRFLRRPSCRFYPSCSQYMAESIERHGVFMGLKLGTIRLCKCHPLNDGGVDEVPVSLKACQSNRINNRGTR